MEKQLFSSKKINWILGIWFILILTSFAFAKYIRVSDQWFFENRKNGVFLIFEMSLFILSIWMSYYASYAKEIYSNNIRLVINLLIIAMLRIVFHNVYILLPIFFWLFWAQKQDSRIYTILIFMLLCQPVLMGANTRTLLSILSFIILNLLDKIKFKKKSMEKVIIICSIFVLSFIILSTLMSLSDIEKLIFRIPIIVLAYLLPKIRSHKSFYWIKQVFYMVYLVCEIINIIVSIIDVSFKINNLNSFAIISMSIILMTTIITTIIICIIEMIIAINSLITIFKFEEYSINFIDKYINQFYIYLCEVNFERKKHLKISNQLRYIRWLLMRYFLKVKNLNIIIN